MAIYNAGAVSRQQPTPVADDVDVVAVRGSLTLTGALLAADVINLVKLPHDSKVVDVILDASAGVGAGAVSLATGGQVLIATNTVTAAGAGVDRLDTVAALNAAPVSGSDTVQFIAAAGGGVVGDIIGCTVLYRNSRYGA